MRYPCWRSASQTRALVNPGWRVAKRAFNLMQKTLYPCSLSNSLLSVWRTGSVRYPRAGRDLPLEG